jgi:heme exporter protein D
MHFLNVGKTANFIWRAEVPEPINVVILHVRCWLGRRKHLNPIVIVQTPPSLIDKDYFQKQGARVT